MKMGKKKISLVGRALENWKRERDIEDEYGEIKYEGEVSDSRPYYSSEGYTDWIGSEKALKTKHIQWLEKEERDKYKLPEVDCSGVDRNSLEEIVSLWVQGFTDKVFANIANLSTSMRCYSGKSPHQIACNQILKENIDLYRNKLRPWLEDCGFNVNDFDDWIADQTEELDSIPIEN